MCTNPIFLRVARTKVYQYRTLKGHVDKETEDILFPYRYQYVSLPCGKCQECLRKKQNELSVRSYIEAKKRGSMHFLTLTYEDDHLPFAGRLKLTDKSTGEQFFDDEAFIVDREILKEYQISKGDFLPLFQKEFKSPKPIYIELDDSKFSLNLSKLPFFDSGFDYSLQLTPSLDRRDVRLWLKRSRIAYLREFGFPLDFTYCVVGEYGPKTCRPHYHIALFGLTDEQANWITVRWKYGYKNLQKVKAINPDGSSGFNACARYIGKYMSKGAFECDSVKEGNAQKPRFCSSIYYGLECDKDGNLSEVLIKYYRCYDLFGRFDIDSLVGCDSSDCTTLPSLRKIHQEVMKRNFIDIGGFKYALPKNLIKKLWYVKAPDGTYRASSIRRVFSSFIQSDFIQDIVDEYRQSEIEPTSEDISKAVAYFKTSQQHRHWSSEKVGKKNSINFYSKSKF